MDINQLKKIEVSPADFCEIFGFSNPNYLSELVNKHGYIRSKHGKYPLIENIKCDKKYNNALHQAALKKLREQNSRSRLEAAQAEYKEVELAKLKGELGSVFEFEMVLKNEALLYKKGLESLKSQLKFDLNLTPEQTEILNEKINSLLNQISNFPGNINAESVSFE